MVSLPEKGGKRTSVLDVAKRAGVSPSTVSRVMRKASYVSPETREKVWEAVRELNYYVNTTARSMVEGKTKTIGLIIYDIANPAFSVITRGVDDTISKFGYGLNIFNTDEDLEKEKKFLKLILERRLDGLIMAPTGQVSQYLLDIQKTGLPVVFVDRKVNNIEADTVQADNFTGSYRLVKHLLENGHHKIGMITWQKDVDTSQDRVRGYQAALVEHGIEFDPAYVMEGNATVERAQHATLQLLDSSEKPTAIYAASNRTSLGALLALKRRNLKIPDDIALVGFDEFEWAQVLDPPLTVVAQPSYNIGTASAQLLLQRLFHEGPPEKQTILLQTHLIIRDSC